MRGPAMRAARFKLHPPQRLAFQKQAALNQFDLLVSEFLGVLHGFAISVGEFTHAGGRRV